MFFITGNNAFFPELFIFCFGPALVLFLLVTALQILAPTVSAPYEDHIPMDQHVLYEISVPPIKYLLSLLEQAPGLEESCK